jgi:hypothetical protein
MEVRTHEIFVEHVAHTADQGVDLCFGRNIGAIIPSLNHRMHPIT